MKYITKYGKKMIYYIINYSIHMKMNTTNIIDKICFSFEKLSLNNNLNVIEFK